LDPTWENIPKSFKDKFIKDFQEKLGETSEKTVEVVAREDILYAYCRKYIMAIYDIVPAIKINSAFFEKEGFTQLYFTIAEVAKKMGLFVIGDVKRADIGSTSAAYAEAFLGKDSPFDAITINPYFGTDGVMPFLKLAKENGKGVFVLVKTSNKSSTEIQDLELKDGRKVYDAVADLVVEWARKVDAENFYEGGSPNYPMVGAVVGATHHEQADHLTTKMADTFFLIPGYGAQGATADDVACNFDYKGVGAIVNSSRGIMQAYKKDCWKDKYSEKTWSDAAKAEAIRATKEINQAINRYLEKDIC
jgi:orotidine-5'-phosphate decarboxylase